MSTMGYPFCDSDCPSVVTSPRHVPRPSVFAFSYVPDNVCHTTLFRIQFVLFLSFRVTPTMILSIFLWVVTSFSSWVLLSDQVSQPYVITGSIHSLNAFLSSLIGTFLSLHDVVQLTECTPSLSTSSIFFPSTIRSPSLAGYACYTLL